MSKPNKSASKIGRTTRTVALLLVGALVVVAAPSMATSKAMINMKAECSVEVEYQDIILRLKCADDEGQCSAKVTYDPSSGMFEAECSASGSQLANYQID